MSKIGPAVRAGMASPDLVDHSLRFGELAFATGRAFTRPGVEDNRPVSMVAKDYVTADDGRKFLSEMIPWSLLKPSVEALPDCNPHQTAAMGKKVSKLSTGYASIVSPPARQTIAGFTRTPGVQMAKLESKARPGVLVDWVVQVGFGFTTPAVWQGDVTYFVTSPVYSYNCRIEAGTIFKFMPASGDTSSDAMLMVGNAFVCDATTFRGVTFTAADDDSIGDTLGPDVWAIPQFGMAGRGSSRRECTMAIPRSASPFAPQRRVQI